MLVCTLIDNILSMYFSVAMHLENSYLRQTKLRVIMTERPQSEAV